MNIKNLPKLKLSDLLRRRKMSLKQFMAEFAITTYDALCLKSDRMGVVPPTKEDFDKSNVGVAVVNSPQEGIVVIEVGLDHDQTALETIGDTTPEIGTDAAQSLSKKSKKQNKQKLSNTDE